MGFYEDPTLPPPPVSSIKLRSNFFRRGPPDKNPGYVPAVRWPVGPLETGRPLRLGGPLGGWPPYFL